MARQTPSRQLDEQLEALLALALDREEPRGPRPTLAEIAAWHDGRLPDSRAGEVKSHVARDSETYALWSTLVAAENVLPVSPDAAVDKASASAGLRARRRVWAGPWFWFGGGLTTAVIALWLVLTPWRLLLSPSWQAGIDDGYAALNQAGIVMPPSWPWANQRVTKGLPWQEDAATRERRRARTAFQAGMRAGLQAAAPADPYWRQVLADLPEQPRECPADPDAAACQARQALLQAAGRWSVLVYAACRQVPAGPGQDSPLGAAFWRAQHGVLAPLAEGFRREGVTPEFQQFFAAWASQSGEPQALLCRQIEAALSLAWQDKSR